MDKLITSISPTATRRGASKLMLALAAAGLVAAAPAGAEAVLTHHLHEAVRAGATPEIGRLPANHVMSLDLVLKVRDEDALESFLADLYNPEHPSFHQYLTPKEFTARFGPTKADYDAVVAFAKAHGLTVTGGSRDGMEVQVKGPVSAVEAAFHVTMKTYRDPEANRVFYSPDREPAVDLPFALWHVSGLDNYSVPHRMLSQRSEAAAGSSPDATTGSGPSNSFLGSDMRAAYYGSGPLTGTGQNLGLFEYEGTDLADLNTYYANVGQTNHVPITLLSTDGTSTSCVYAVGRCDDTEQTLDMTQALGMAPGLASLTMYVGGVDTAIFSSMTTHSPLPNTIGVSWGWKPADPSTLNPYFRKAAAQGQNIFVASGDDATWSTASNNYPWPAESPLVVTVGGTDLVTASAGGPWKSETAWVDSGGGIASPDKLPIPAWQKYPGVITATNGGSTVYRNGPDVSANANFTFYTCAKQTACLANEYGGTSFAAPMWAGFVALVNQQLAELSKPPIGFINPTIYKDNLTAAKYSATFHDITSGAAGSYSAVKGYDLVTGWGSPKAALIKELAP